MLDTVRRYVARIPVSVVQAVDHAHRPLRERFMPGHGIALHAASSTPDASSAQSQGTNQFQPSLPWQVEELDKGLCPNLPINCGLKDITYIPLLPVETSVTCIWSRMLIHKIVDGYWLRACASATLEALRQATDHAVEMTGSENLEGLIHHSDRGVLLRGARDVGYLRWRHGIAISMTEDRAHGQCRGGTYQWDTSGNASIGKWLFETIERALA